MDSQTSLHRKQARAPYLTCNEDAFDLQPACRTGALASQGLHICDERSPRNNGGEGGYQWKQEKDVPVVRVFSCRRSATSHQPKPL